MEDLRRIQITHIHKKDGFYGIKHRYIGLTGMFKLYHNTHPGYYSGDFYPEDKKITGDSLFFLGIRYRRI